MNVAIIEDNAEDLRVILDNLTGALRGWMMAHAHPARRAKITPSNLFAVKNANWNLNKADDIGSIYLYGIHCRELEYLREQADNLSLFAFDVSWENAKLSNYAGVEAAAKFSERYSVERIRLVTSQPDQKGLAVDKQVFKIIGYSKVDNYDQIANWIGSYWMRLQEADVPLGKSNISLELARLWNAGGPCIIGHSFGRVDDVYTRFGMNVLRMLSVPKDDHFDPSSSSHVAAAVADSKMQLGVFLDFMRDDERFPAACRGPLWQGIVTTHDAIKQSLDSLLATHGGATLSIENYGRAFSRHTMPAKIRDIDTRLYLFHGESGKQNKSFAHRVMNRINDIAPNKAVVTNTETSKLGEVFLPRQEFEDVFGLSADVYCRSHFIEFLAKEAESIRIGVVSKPLGKQGPCDTMPMIDCFLIIEWPGDKPDLSKGRAASYSELHWLQKLIAGNLAEWVYKLYLVKRGDRHTILHLASDGDHEIEATTDCGLSQIRSVVSDIECTQNALVFEIMSCGEAKRLPSNVGRT